MWEALCRLPRDFTGGNILSFLSICDLGNIDTAIISKPQRCQLHEMIIFLDPVPLDPYLEVSSDLLLWCFKRSLIVRDVVIESYDANLMEILSTHPQQLGSGMCFCFRTNKHHVPINLFEYCGFFDKLDRLELWSSNSHENFKAISSSVRQIKFLQIKAGLLEEHNLELISDMLLRNAHSITDLSIEYRPIIRTSQCITSACTLPHVTELTLSNAILTNDDLIFLGGILNNLERLCITLSRAGRELPHVDVGFIHLVQKNPHLRKLQVDTCISNRALASIAHLVRLDELEIGCTQVDDEIVRGFADNGITRLKTDCFRLESPGPNVCSSFFSRLRVLHCHIKDASSVASGPFVLPHLLSLQELHLRDNSDGTACEVIEGISQNCPMLRNFYLLTNKTVTLSEMKRVVRNHPLLEQLNTVCQLEMTDELLFDIAEFCPLLKMLNIPMGSAISDRGIHALASGCTALEHLHIADTQPLTDTSLTELALHCPNLTSFSAERGTLATERGLRALEAACPKLQMVDLGNGLTLQSLRRESILSGHCDDYDDREEGEVDEGVGVGVGIGVGEPGGVGVAVGEGVGVGVGDPGGEAPVFMEVQEGHNGYEYDIPRFDQLHVDTMNTNPHPDYHADQHHQHQQQQVVASCDLKPEEKEEKYEKQEKGEEGDIKQKHKHEQELNHKRKLIAQPEFEQDTKKEHHHHQQHNHYFFEEKGEKNQHKPEQSNETGSHSFYDATHYCDLPPTSQEFRGIHARTSSSNNNTMNNFRAHSTSNCPQQSKDRGIVDIEEEGKLKVVYSEYSDGKCKFCSIQ